VQVGADGRDLLQRGPARVFAGAGEAGGVLRERLGLLWKEVGA
jgi:hypothetical protein